MKLFDLEPHYQIHHITPDTEPVKAKILKEYADGFEESTIGRTKFDFTTLSGLS